MFVFIPKQAVFKHISILRVSSALMDAARKRREEKYAQRAAAKEREAYLRRVREARRSLHIGNPIIRAAIERDKEAIKLEKRSDLIDRN